MKATKKTKAEVAEERAKKALAKTAKTAHDDLQGMQMDASEFYAEHADILDEYNVRQSRVSDAKGAFKNAYLKAYPTLGKKYGSFTIVEKTDIDVDLLDSLLEATNNPLRGDLITTTKSLDRKKYYAAVDSQKIPMEIAEEVESLGNVSIRGK